MQIAEQTDEEKLVMYMKCTKKQLAEMLIQCNKILDTIPKTVETYADYYDKKPTETFKCKC